MRDLVGAVSEMIGLQRERICEIARRAPTRYRIKTIPKQKGGHRTIYNPASETKALQYALMHLVLQKLPVSDIAFGYREGISSPLRKNASVHSNKRYTVTLDFHDFFPSIIPTDLELALRRCHTTCDLDQSDLEFVKRTLFAFSFGRWFLSIGAPSSPMVSNAVMRDIDSRIKSTALSIDSNGVVTRYADDLCFSTDKKGMCGQFVDALCSILKETPNPRLQINASKTLFSSVGSRRRIVGLIVTPDGRVTVGRNKKREIVAMFHHYLQGRLTREQKSYLQGYVAFVADVDPSFVNTLAMKYGGDAIQRLRIGEH